MLHSNSGEFRHRTHKTFYLTWTEHLTICSFCFCFLVSRSLQDGCESLAGAGEVLGVGEAGEGGEGGTGPPPVLRPPLLSAPAPAGMSLHHLRDA